MALQLGHRQSVDLDWFTASELADPLALAEQIRSGAVALETTSVAPGTLHGRVLGVRSSFLSYRYPLLQPRVECPGFGCSLASLEDLGAMKLAAVAQRGARKDFLDVFAIGRNGLELRRMIEIYRQKYSVGDIGHVLAGLCYFEDAERDPMPLTLAPVGWVEVKATIRSWVKELAGLDRSSR